MHLFWPLGRITLTDYDEYVKDLKARQEQLDEQLVTLTHNDKSFMLTSSYLLEIATKAPKLFQSSKAALKSKLLRFLLSNLVIQDKKLVFNLKTPFDVIAECSKNQSWLSLVDEIRTNNYGINGAGTLFLDSIHNAAH